MPTTTPRVTAAQKAANEWIHLNWHDGIKVAGSDSAYGAFWAFCAGVDYAQGAADLIEQLERELSQKIDALDMMRDEFRRIIACPGCNAEIEDLANRAQIKLIQHVPVIEQRDRAEREVSQLRAALELGQENCDAVYEDLRKERDEARRDRARLDWLEEQYRREQKSYYDASVATGDKAWPEGFTLIVHCDDGKIRPIDGDTFRAAIDAAMKAAP